MGSPVPHVERMDTVVRVTRPIEVNVPGILGEIPLEPGLDLLWVACLGENVLPEVDVGRMEDRVELGPGGVAHDEHAALANQWLALVHVEEVAQPQAVDQDRIHDRIDVVGTDEWESHGENVALTLHLNQLLLVDVLERAGMDRLHFTGVDPGQTVGRADGGEDVARQPGRRDLERLRSRQERDAVLQ